MLLISGTARIDAVSISMPISTVIAKTMAMGTRITLSSSLGYKHLPIIQILIFMYCSQAMLAILEFYQLDKCGFSSSRRIVTIYF